LVRVEDRDGAVGWGEVYASFPPGAGEHRVRLLNQLFAPIVCDSAGFENPNKLHARLENATRILALQSGELGPLAQCQAGIDIAVWDLLARRNGTPLWRFLLACARPKDELSAPTSPLALPVYASGINPDYPERLVRAAWDAGHRAFKLKLGFGRERDLRNVRAARAELGEGVPIMADANQAWELSEAIAMAHALAPYGLVWLEEPMPADTPYDTWRALVDVAPMPIAAGENLRSRVAYEDAIAAGVFGILQPDPIKWGGFTGSLPVVRRIVKTGIRFCPHYLGGGIGLLAAAHLLAASEAPGGFLEYDVNENPLRNELIGDVLRVEDGRVTCPATPGLGAEPDFSVAAAYIVC